MDNILNEIETIRLNQMENAMNEIETVTHERDMLAEAIGNAAVKSGIYRSGMSFSGPQLLMACDDMADCIIASSTPTIPIDIRSLKELVNDVLDRDGGKTCECINHSRKAELEYESGTCPHQRLAAFLVKISK